MLGFMKLSSRNMAQDPPSGRDFAPNFLRLQESPPSPLPRMVLYTLLTLCVLLLLWAVFGRLDIIASAEGKLVPKDYLNIVQPAEGGIVREILVSEGQSVSAGQLLLRLDASVLDAETKALETELAIRDLQMRRIDAELSGGAMKRLATDPPDLFSQALAHFHANRKAYQDTLDQEYAALVRIDQELHAAKEIQTKLKQTVPLYWVNLERFEKLKKDGFVTDVYLDERRREKIEKEQDLNAQDYTVASAEANFAQTEKKLTQITSSYHQQLHAERAQAESSSKKLKQDLAKQHYRNKFVELKAPKAGVVKDIATHTLGTVVSPGTILLTVVPGADELEADVMIKNQDVGFVAPGQAAKLKIAAYPFQKYGMLQGKISRVSADASETSGSKPQEFSAEGKTTINSTYRARITLDTRALKSEQQRLLLVSGMQVVGEIKLGQRSVLEYLLAPVQKAWHESGRER